MIARQEHIDNVLGRNNSPYTNQPDHSLFDYISLEILCDLTDWILSPSVIA